MSLHDPSLPAGFKQAIACPFCGSTIGRTYDTRNNADCTDIRRRRECLNGHRFTTHERRGPTPPRERALDFQI